MNTVQALQEAHAWVITDAEGRAQLFSSRIHDVLGEPRLDRGDDLVSRLSWRRKPVLFDMEVALTGWPTERTLLMAVTSKGHVAVRYRVSRERFNDGMGLVWVLTVARSGESFQRAA